MTQSDGAYQSNNGQSNNGQSNNGQSNKGKPAAFPNEVPPAYYDDVYRRNRGIQSKWHHLKFARFQRDMPAGADHLDVGYGPGTFIGSLSSECRSTGVDVTRKFLDVARSRYGAPNKTFAEMTAGFLEFDDNTFDVVTCIEVIEHIGEAGVTRLLGEIRRVLRPGGLLLASTPNYASPWPVVEAVVNRFGDVSYAHDHITLFTSGRLSAALDSAGYIDTNVEGWMFAAPFTAALGWRLADQVERFEPSWLVSRWGLLLYAKGIKPA